MNKSDILYDCIINHNFMDNAPKEVIEWVQQLDDLADPQADKLRQLEQEVKELKALLAEIYDIGDLREYLLEYVPEMEQAKKALAQHNKQVSIKAIEELKHRIIECREMELSQCDVYTIGLIAEQFKQGFDIFETPDSV